jgi:hypothetical protein
VAAVEQPLAPVAFQEARTKAMGEERKSTKPVWWARQASESQRPALPEAEEPRARMVLQELAPVEARWKKPGAALGARRALEQRARQTCANPKTKEKAR